MILIPLIGVILAFVFTLFQLILYKIGLNSLNRFFYRGIFFTEETFWNQHIIWNKPIFRYTVAFSICVVLTALILSIFKVKFDIKQIIIGALAIYTLICFSLPYIKLPNIEKKTKIDTSKGFVFNGNTHKTIHVENPTRGIFICGGAGSGKSASLVIPIIQQAGKQNFTGIVYDFKFPSLAKEVAGSYQDSTISQYYINFTDLQRTNRVNPIAPEYVLTPSHARECAKTLLFNLDFKAASNRDYWIQSSEALLTGTIWFLRANYPQYCTLPHVISLILQKDSKKLLEFLNTDLQTRVLISSITSSIENEKQLTGIISSIQNYLSQLATPEIFWILSENEVNLDLNNPNSKGILTIGNSSTLSSVISPIVSLIISTSLKMLNQPNKEPSIVLLDEAPTLFIPNFSQIPATAREYKVSTVYVVQDIAQMQGMMNDKETEMIISNLANQFYGRTTNTTTADRVSKIFGKHDKEYTSYSRGTSTSDDTSFNRGESTSVQQRDIITSSDVIRMQTGEFCGIIAEGAPREFKDILKYQSSMAKEIQIIHPLLEREMHEKYSHIDQEMKLLNI
jgi:type IV secretory pathway TraG/TraD family ATPase VirD4